MGEHPYRPLPTPPRMRWAVVARPWLPRLVSSALGSALVCCWLNRDVGWLRSFVGSFGWLIPLCLVGLRLVRVPVEPPRVRVAETDTLEEHRDLTDAGYVYDHEARVYRLDDGWEHDPRMWGVRWRTRRG